MKKFKWLIVLCVMFAKPLLAFGQEKDCAKSVNQAADLTYCITPLEDAVDKTFQRLRNRFKENREILIYFSDSKMGWQAYYRNHCVLESVLVHPKLRPDIDQTAGLRVTASCLQRVLSNRLKELETLERSLSDNMNTKW